MAIRAVALLGAAASLFLSGCASVQPVPVNHRAYQKMPDDLTTRFYRGLAWILPATREKAFWGRWGGTGNLGGKPIDVLDEGFRRHDVVYYEVRCHRQLVAADRGLVGWLERIDPHDLAPDQLAFRDRVLGFFRSPLSHVIGKPLYSFVHTREREGCSFTCPEVVLRFFDPAEPGFPPERTTVAGAKK